jgi:hypothetical protein
MIGIPSKTTVRSVVAFAGTLPLKPTALAWWVPLGYLLTTVPADTQPPGDLKHPMHGHQAID